jgi:hypothetical protein
MVSEGNDWNGSDHPPSAPQRTVYDGNSRSPSLQRGHLIAVQVMERSSSRRDDSML